MQIKMLISKKERELIQLSKRNRYSTSHTSIRDSYELQTIISDYKYSVSEIKELSSTLSLDSDRINTTYNLRQEIVDYLDELALTAGINRSLAIRCILAIYEQKYLDSNDYILSNDSPQVDISALKLQAIQMICDCNNTRTIKELLKTLKEAETIC